MHIPWNVAHVDNVQDDAFLGGRRDNDWGGEYGPYQITKYSTGEAGSVAIGLLMPQPPGSFFCQSPQVQQPSST